MSVNTEFLYQESNSNIIVEIGEDSNKQERAIVTYPLMHVGPNKKHLWWTEEALEKIAEMFRGIPFKYDVKGDKGSSHVPDNLFSPFYDVGWTYSNENGAWYDKKTKTLWIKGEVTQPEVVEKLKRKTTEGKSELNYASMGVFISPEEAINSITNKQWDDDDEYERGESYNGKVCYLVPMSIKKALHVALTNDPADTEAELAQLAFAEGGIMDMTNTMPVTSEAFKSMAERVKALEEQNKIEGGKMIGENINGTPAPATPQQETGQEGQPQAQPQPTLADVMAVLQQVLVKLGANGTETADGTATAEDPKDAVVPPEEPPVNENSLPKVPEGSEKDKGNAVNEGAVDEPDKTKNNGNGNGDNNTPAPIPEKTETADNSELNKLRKKLTEKVKLEVASQTMRLGKHKDRNVALKEFADKTLEELEMINSTLAQIPSPTGVSEFADNMPEFGGMGQQKEVLEVADMGAKGRREKFGEYGAYDVCFHPENANKFIGR